MPQGPLSPYRVADLTRVLAGPYCTMQLADLGAEVVKVEAPGKGDDTRAWGPPFVQGESAYFLSVNRGKKSLTLNLKTDQGKQVLWRLLQQSDVLVENFRPGALARLGFDYQTVRQRLPGLVHCSISGFGHSGPMRDLPGYDVLIQGESGLMSVTGEVDGPPLKVGVSISDVTAGMMACQGILAALLQRERTQTGQQVDIAMLDVSAALLTYQAGIYHATGVAPRRRGNAHPTIAPYSTYQTQDGVLILAVGNDSLFVRFCEAAGCPQLAGDARFATAAARVENRDALDDLLAGILAARPRDAWIQLLQRAGVPCGAVRDVGEVCQSEQLRARGVATQVRHPVAGDFGQVGSPLLLSGQPRQQLSPPPLLGQHNEELLLGLLAYEPDEVARMREGGVI